MNLFAGVHHFVNTQLAELDQEIAKLEAGGWLEIELFFWRQTSSVWCVVVVYLAFLCEVPLS